MSNHVRNIVKMQGIGSLPLYSVEHGGAGGNGEAASWENFDFNKIIPMPEPLKLYSGTIEDVAMEAALMCIAEAVARDSIFPSFIVDLRSGQEEPLENRVEQCFMTMREAE